MARDEVAKDDMRWQGMEEGWQMDECHHSIGRWSCPMRCEGLADASLGFRETLRRVIKKGKGFPGKLRLWAIVLAQKTYDLELK